MNYQKKDTTIKMEYFNRSVIMLKVVNSIKNKINSGNMEIPESIKFKKTSGAEKIYKKFQKSS